jgi:hypothetical protein
MQTEVQSSAWREFIQYTVEKYLKPNSYVLGGKCTMSCQTLPQGLKNLAVWLPKINQYNKTGTLK